MTPGQIDVNDPSSRDVAFRSLFFLFWNHRSAQAKMRGTPAIKPYLTLIEGVISDLITHLSGLSRNAGQCSPVLL